MNIALMVALSALLAAWMLWSKPGQEFEAHPVGRFILVSVGVLIVIVLNTWGHWAEMQRWFTTFAIAAAPQLVYVAIATVQFQKEQERRRLTGHNAGKVDDDE